MKIVATDHCHIKSNRQKIHIVIIIIIIQHLIMRNITGHHGHSEAHYSLNIYTYLMMTPVMMIMSCTECITVVPALGDPCRERPPAVYGYFVNVPKHVNVKLPLISGHLPNADADSHLLVVSTCYNGQCKQMPRFRWSFQQKLAGAHPNLGSTVHSNFRAVVW